MIYYINSLITDIINHYLGGKIVGFISQPENKKSVVNGQSLSEPSTEELEADNLSDGTTIVAGDDASNPVSPISQYETKSGDSFWNIAKNQLPAGASNAQIQAQVLKLMELNPEIDPRGLQIGHQLNIIDPGSNITVSDTTMMNYNISDSEYRKDLEARLANNITESNANLSNISFGNFEFADQMSYPDFQQINQMSFPNPEFYNNYDGINKESQFGFNTSDSFYSYTSSDGKIYDYSFENNLSFNFKSDPEVELGFLDYTKAAIKSVSWLDVGLIAFDIANTFTVATAGPDTSIVAGANISLKFGKNIAKISASKAANVGAKSAKQAANLKTHLRQADIYGQSGIRELSNGKIRYYGKTKPPNTPGEMAGRRTVREWDPKTGRQRTWHETVDHNNKIRQVRPQFNNSNTKTHYRFDQNGKYIGKW